MFNGPGHVAGRWTLKDGLEHRFAVTLDIVRNARVPTRAIKTLLAADAFHIHIFEALFLQRKQKASFLSPIHGIIINGGTLTF